MAQALGTIGRRYRRRRDLSAEDELVSEFLVEILARLSRLSASHPHLLSFSVSFCLQTDAQEAEKREIQI